jgi:hypothetical protein
MGRGVLTNEDFIAKYRDWRSLRHPTDERVEQEVSYLSKLADFIAPVPLVKATKAVRWDFQVEEATRAQSPEVRRGVFNLSINVSILFDAFRAELKRNP